MTQNTSKEYVGANHNKLLVPGVASALEAMKMEIAEEFGVVLGPETTARQNGSVGGEMTKRLVTMAQQMLAEGTNSK